MDESTWSNGARRRRCSGELRAARALNPPALSGLSLPFSTTTDPTARGCTRGDDVEIFRRPRLFDYEVERRGAFAWTRLARRGCRMGYVGGRHLVAIGRFPALPVAARGISATVDMSGEENTAADGLGAGADFARGQQDTSRGQLLRPRAMLGAIRRRLRTAAQRALHPGRRRRARERLRGLGKVERVLFVCHGNIYRSPFAEGAFLHLLPRTLRGRIAVASAGFVGPGRPAPPESVTLAASQGFDLTEHRSQLLTPAMVKESDLVVVMSAAQEQEICRRFSYPRRRVLVLGDLDPWKIDTRDVADPWNQPTRVLESSAARVTRCTRELVAELSATLGDVPEAAEDQA